MHLEVFAITLVMFLLASVPILIPHVRNYYGPLFLFGTGSLLGICAFDLAPDVFELGGFSGISLVVGVWAIYSAVHLFHSHDHIEEHPKEEGRTPYVFLTAISAHCFSSGLLLGVSGQFSAKLSHAVFTALLAHKIYEAMAVSSMLVGYERKTSWTLAMLGLYLASFPAGAFFTEIFKGQISHTWVLFISGLALGSLAGCLLFDFLIPSIKHLRKSAVKAPWQVAWLAAGIVLTYIFI